MKVHYVRCLPWLAAILLSPLLQCKATAVSTPEQLSDNAFPEAASIGKTNLAARPFNKQSSGHFAQGILPRGDDPVPLLWPGGPEYPSKENPPLPKSKAGDKWFQEPIETRPLLRPGRTDSAARVKWPVAGWWQHKGAASSNRLNTATASSSSSSTPPGKKSAWHRAAKAVLQQGKKAGKVGKWFKKQNNRRDLQLHSRDALTSEGPLPALSDSEQLPARRRTARRRTIERGLYRRGQVTGKIRSAPSPSKPSWPTMFPLDVSASDSSRHKESGKQKSSSLSPMRNGKDHQRWIGAPPPSPKGAPAKLSRATSELAMKNVTPKPQKLTRAASGPSTNPAPWRLKKPASPTFLHKGRPVWEDWGQYFKPLPQPARGGGEIKIAPKEVRQGKPTGKNPGGLSKLFADEQP